MDCQLGHLGGGNDRERWINRRQGGYLWCQADRQTGGESNRQTEVDKQANRGLQK